MAVKGLVDVPSPEVMVSGMGWPSGVAPLCSCRLYAAPTSALYPGAVQRSTVEPRPAATGAVAAQTGLPGRPTTSSVVRAGSLASPSALIATTSKLYLPGSPPRSGDSWKVCGNGVWPAAGAMERGGGTATPFLYTVTL